MNIDFLNLNQELSVILKDFKNFLKDKSIIDKRCLDFISYILDLYDISKSYVNAISFDSKLESKGLYSPFNKKIIFNISYLDAAYKLGFITSDQELNEYFNLILHEINHVLQYRYKNSIDNDVSKILKMSDELKIQSQEKYYLYYNLFPDEIDSNIRAANIVNKLNMFGCSETFLINSLITSMQFNNYLIPSQFQFLHKQILKLDVDDKFELINPLYYGTKKEDELIKAVIKSYQTQELCVDIDRGRRLLK